MTERRCTDCDRILKPTHRRSRCHTCRKRDLCACGRFKQKPSALCDACNRALQVGPGNGNWQGGTTIHKAGYVMIKTPGHPRARSNNGYVFEHILVMETLLGRYLVPEETVHHLNGVKDDNRPDNLELLTRPQPSGIRASDAVAWAREILARYEPEGPNTTTLTNLGP